MRAPVVIACLALVLWCGVAAAASIEIPLPSLLGSWSRGTSRSVALGLGAPVDSIISVSVRWAGTGTAGLGHGDGVERPADERGPARHPASAVAHGCATRLNVTRRTVKTLSPAMDMDGWPKSKP